MNILLINHYAGSVRHGMEFRPYYLAREWVKAGHNVTIVAASRSHVRQRQPVVNQPVSEEMIDGIRYVWLRTPDYEGNGARRFVNMLSFVMGLYRYPGSIIGDMVPDVVVASSTYPLDIYPARSFARLYNARLVFEVHDLWPLSPMELGGMSKWHPFIMLMQLAENFACRHADKVISILPKTASHLQQHGMAAEKFVHVPNGIEVGESDATGEVLPAEHEAILSGLKAEGRMLVGYAGAHGIANALDTLIDAASRLRNTNVAIVLVGNGPERERLMQRAAEEDLLDCVYFLSALPKSSVPGLLEWMDVLYIGLKREPLFRFGISPNKLMDYMLAAKPVIQSIDAGNDMVGDADCGITIIPEDPEATAEAIRRIGSMPESERQSLGEKGREYVLQNHDYVQLADRFMEALK